MNKMLTKSKSKIKTSLDYISNQDTEILILGTLPGEMSLEIKQYYANPRNKFWGIIAYITKAELPETYDEKIKLLLKHKIGLWDVIHQAKREGSLDNNIMDEVSNKLNEFISEHNNLKIIGFNGQKSEKIFRKYFQKQENIKYIVLPSTSPANTRIKNDEKCERWKVIMKTS